MPGPLAGLRVLELARILAGPWAGQVLADLGADVIKVEPPQGDYGRRMTWPIVDGVSLLFLHVSRGKRSIVLDLRTDEGKAAFLYSHLVKKGKGKPVEEQGVGALDRRDYAQAKQIFTDLTLRYPNEPRPKVLLAQTHLGLAGFGVFDLIDSVLGAQDPLPRFLLPNIALRASFRHAVAPRPQSG